MKYIYIPPDRFGPLKWGMKIAAVDDILGPPEKISKSRAGNIRQIRNNQAGAFIFDRTDGQLIEVASLSGKAEIEFDGIELVGGDSENVVKRLLVIDTTAFQGHGSIVYPRLGISLTGYIPEDLEIRAASAFAPGLWDEMLTSMKPFRSTAAG